MGVSTLQSLVTSAQSAIASSEWTSAENYLLQAQAHLVGMPDVDSAGESLRWRDTIDKLIANVRSKLSAGTTSSGGAIQRTQVTYKRTGGTEGEY